MTLTLLALLAAAPAEPPPLSLVRKHTAGQKYAVEYTNTDGQLKVSKTFKGTAVVKKVEGAATLFELTVDSLEWTSAAVSKRTGSGVKVKAKVEGDQIDAEITNPGTVGEDAEFELTAFEQLLGDVCQPPPGPYYPKRPIGNWVIVAQDEKVVRMKSTPPPDADPFTCDLNISRDDAFAGERTAIMKVKLDKGQMVEQRQTLKVKRL